MPKRSPHDPNFYTRKRDADTARERKQRPTYLDLEPRTLITRLHIQGEQRSWPPATEKWDAWFAYNKAKRFGKLAGAAKVTKEAADSFSAAMGRAVKERHIYTYTYQTSNSEVAAVDGEPVKPKVKRKDRMGAWAVHDKRCDLAKTFPAFGPPFFTGSWNETGLKRLQQWFDSPGRDLLLQQWSDNSWWEYWTVPDDHSYASTEVLKICNPCGEQLFAWLTEQDL